MIRHLLPLGLLLAALSGRAQAQDDPVLDRIVANARAQIGVADPDWGGWSLSAARAEGRTLLLEMSPPAGSAELLTPQELTDAIAIGMCESTGGRFFEEARTLRIALSGSAAPPRDFRACPTTTRSEIVLQSMARFSQRLVGTVIGPMRIRITRVHVDGSAMVFTVEGSPGWRRQYPGAIIAREFFVSYCSNGANPGFLSDGRTMRIDSTENGRALQRGISLSDCAAYRPR